MKKIIAVFMVLSIVLAFAGCKSKEYTETVVTIPVTDENGEPVTDKDGNVVTEVSTEAESSTQGSGKEDTKPSSTAAGGKEETSKGNSGNSNNNNNTTTTQNNNNNNNTTKPTEQGTTKPTEAPTKSKKRDIHLIVNVPTYTPVDTKLTIQYRVEGEKKFKELSKEDVKLGEAFTKEYDIKNIKGAVEFIITIDGVDLTNNKFTVESSDKDQTHEITLVTGIEVMEGGWD